MEAAPEPVLLQGIYGLPATPEQVLPLFWELKPIDGECSSKRGLNPPTKRGNQNQPGVYACGFPMTTMVSGGIAVSLHCLFSKLFYTFA